MQWHSRYKNKCTSAEEAVKVIKSGDNVYVHPGCAIPEVLLRAMIARGPELRDVTVHHILTIGEAGYVSEEMQGHFRHNALFIGSNVRKAVNDGLADTTLIYLHEVASLFELGIIPIDVALIHVSPPDKHGYCSFGVGVEMTTAACEKAKTIIAQVNPRMPRVHGYSFIHVDKIHHIVEIDEPIREFPQVDPITDPREAEMYRNIGAYIADLIEDESTLQMGIGSIPDAVLSFIGNKRDLGIHTEMFSDGVIPLVENGVITNMKKTLHRGKMVASFVLGGKQIFDFIDDNPLVEFHPSHYVNDPCTIAKNRKMVAINSALMVDITGQVCADSIGPKFYSGFGGQVDFIRGASHSEGGKPIIALPATAKNWTVSRIVPHLLPGAGVTTNRADVHYVVTEYGVASLFGKTIRQRVQELINIAHPDFRDELRSYAKKNHYI
ncbi:MAG: acetyl-CoA hydrolase/transferase C-terminal domain-containing protein [Bacteroidota bacterium]|nr:acetyl-CoA hydrolase/transferase C-terminal domain-containing protein [Bacteroidota bacterium]